MNNELRESKQGSKKPKYFATWGRSRTPKIQADAERILRDIHIFTDKAGDPRTALNNLWRVPGEYTADQARILIKREDPRAKLVVGGGKVKAGAHDAPGMGKVKLRDILQKYSPADYFVNVVDSRGRMFNPSFDGKFLRLRTGVAIESVEKFPTDSVIKRGARVVVRDRKLVAAPRGSGAFYVPGDRNYLDEELA